MTASIGPYTRSVPIQAETAPESHLVSVTEEAETAELRRGCDRGVQVVLLASDIKNRHVLAGGPAEETDGPVETAYVIHVCDPFGQ